MEHKVTCKPSITIRYDGEDKKGLAEAIDLEIDSFGSVFREWQPDKAALAGFERAILRSFLTWRLTCPEDVLMRQLAVQQAQSGNTIP